MENKLLWWGYRHVNGSVQAKRFFDKRDVDDTRESDFVAIVVDVFYASSREEALAFITKQTQL